MQPCWKTHKFGGTSVLNADRYREVRRILIEIAAPGPKAVVVSAMKGVTDDLLRATDLACRRDEAYKAALASVCDRHVEAIESLLSGAPSAVLVERVRADCGEIQEILRAAWLVKGAAEHIRDLVAGMGEIWSAQILAAFLSASGQAACYLDARTALVVDRKEASGALNWEKSRAKFKAWKDENKSNLVVISGFVASDDEGRAATLGRNGSDYSASIFGSLFGSDEIFIWTDVDGVLSADPRLVPEAIVLNEMSYDEVAELAYFGAKVVHPSTMAPAVAGGSVIWIKNAFNPTFPGTKIHAHSTSSRPVKGFSSINDMSLVNVEGPGMLGVVGVAERLFGSLRAAGVNVVLISQASSEHSICLAIRSDQSEIAKRAIAEAFYAEIQRGLIERVQVSADVSVLAAVGDGMANLSGVSGRFLSALGDSGVNVRAIAQGSSERNVSVVIDSRDAMRALRTVHSAFILPRQRISVGLIGVGLIGSAFLKQLQERLVELRAEREVDIQVRAIANSKSMLLSEEAIALDRWKELLAAGGKPIDLAQFSAHVKASHIPHAAIIEATASGELVGRVPEWLAQGLHVISPNKKANSGALSDFEAIRRAAKRANRHYLYSTNVGAGLPIIQSIRDLRATGDQVLAIEGILSGTLSYIFNQYDGSRPFSKIVLEAKEKGFTEPDPREDLSGQDVMRKLVILGREAGLAVSPEDVAVEGLVPQALRSASAGEFLARLPEMDAEMAQRMAQAKASGMTLRFLASIERKPELAPSHSASGHDAAVGAFAGARVGLKLLPLAHAFGRITGTDNIVLVKTKRYFEQPLIIQGPGAGPEVTAAGVFADLVRLSRYLGANS